MDMETLALVLVCVITLIVIPALIIRRIKEHRRIKKAAKEAVKSVTEKKPEDKTPAKTAVSRVRTDAEEKHCEKPKETPAKPTVSRVKTDPAFSEKKPSEKSKPKETKPQSSMETETLLRVEKSKKDYWKCYSCGTENEKSAFRCQVCAQEKPPAGI